MPKVIIKAIQCVTCLRLHPDDRDVWGRYAVEVFEAEDDDEAVALALDGFYAFVPMRHPEHFRLEVFHENGRRLRSDSPPRLMTGFAGGLQRLPWL